jgi:hypothetical protein
MTPEEGAALKPGDIVQLDLNATANPGFACCLMVVEETKSWGVQGYVQMPGSRDGQGGQAYYRAPWAELWATGGKATWLAFDPDAANA